MSSILTLPQDFITGTLSVCGYNVFVVFVFSYSFFVLLVTQYRLPRRLVPKSYFHMVAQIVAFGVQYLHPVVFDTRCTEINLDFNFDIKIIKGTFKVSKG